MQKRRQARTVPELPAQLEAPAPVVVKEAIFTGKRRPRIKRICRCGCGETFTTTFEDKLYKNETHKKRKKRRLSPTRAGTKGEK
jgi:hypothetical protein